MVGDGAPEAARASGSSRLPPEAGTVSFSERMMGGNDPWKRE